MYSIFMGHIGNIDVGKVYCTLSIYKLVIAIES